MACPQALQEGSAYREMILKPRPDANKANVYSFTRTGLLEHKARTSTGTNIAEQERQAEQEYINSQRTILMSSAFITSHNENIEALTGSPTIICRRKTVCLAPPRCTCAGRFRMLLVTFSHAPHLATNEKIYKWIVINCDDSDDNCVESPFLCEDAKAGNIIVGCIKYLRHLLAPVHYDTDSCDYWDKTSAFLRAMIKYIVIESLVANDEVPIREEIATRLGTRNQNCIDVVCVTLWLLTTYDVCFSLEDKEPSVSRRTDYYMPDSTANEIVFLHSCVDSKFGLNIRPLSFAKAIKACDPQFYKEIIDQYIEQEINDKFRKYLPCKSVDRGFWRSEAICTVPTNANHFS